MTLMDDLDYTIGEEFAAAYRKHGTRAVVRREMRALLSQASQPVFVGTQAPTAPATHRQRHMRELLNVVPTTDGRVAYIRELNAAANESAAVPTVENSPKPEVQMQFDPLAHEARVKKIPAFIPATDEVYQDGPGLAAYIDARLTYMALLASDNQSLNGTDDPNDPAVPGYRGFLNDPGVVNLGAVTGTAKAVTASVARVGQNGGVPTGVVVNWADWKAAFDTDPTFWNNLEVPYLPTSKIAPGQILAGDFANGSMLRTHGDVTLSISDQHLDFFTSGKKALLVELREVLTISAPDLYVKATAA